MLDTALSEAVGLLYGDQTRSFAWRAARLSGVRGYRAANEPASQGDFLDALRQLGADPHIHQMQGGSGPRRMMRVHLSCSLDDWSEVFGEPGCVEEIVATASNRIIHRWTQWCSDGSISCLGDLFQRSPDVRWVVVRRVTLL